MDVENKPNSDQDLLKKADQLRLAGAFQKSQEILEQLIEKNPFFSPAKLSLGRVFFESGDLEKARVTLEEFCEFIPDHPLANKILAKIYLHFSQHSRATDKIQMVIKSNPEDTFARRMFDQIQEEASDERNADDEETKKNTPPARTATIAEIYRNQGHLQEALDIYTALAEQNAEDQNYQKKIQEIQNEISPPAREPSVINKIPKVQTAEPGQQIFEAKKKSVTTDKKTRKQKLEHLLHIVQQHRGSHV